MDESRKVYEFLYRGMRYKMALALEDRIVWTGDRMIAIPAGEPIDPEYSIVGTFKAEAPTASSVGDPARQPSWRDRPPLL